MLTAAMTSRTLREAGMEAGMKLFLMKVILRFSHIAKFGVRASPT
jgi:hypothetical protein